MTEQAPQQISNIANKAAFLQAIGVDPATVVDNSLAVSFAPDGTPIVQFTVAVGVPPHILGLAFMASSGGMNGAGGDSVPLEPPTPIKPQDRKRPAKKTAAKRPPRKAVGKKEEGSDD